MSEKTALTYIEKDFPVEKLTPIVTKEANYKRPIYQIHKWWARRLSSVFRMLLISSFCEDIETRKGVWRKYENGHSLEGKVIVDPMMGGGTSIIEALKLGGKVIGIDINPVAWFVTKKEVEPINLGELDRQFRLLEDDVGKRIKKYYETICPNNHRANIMYAMWHKQVDCAKCQQTVSILQEYLISEKEVQEIGSTKQTHLVIFCPRCREIFSRKHDIKTFVTCPGCRFKFRPRVGTSNKGIIICRNCGNEESMTSAVEREGGPLKIVPFCIEYHCKSCDKRGYKKPDSTDVAMYEQARNELTRLRATLPFPKEKIPEGHNDHRPQNHGHLYFYQLFNDRQLLCLSMLLEAICKVDDRNIREFLLLAFSSCLETNNLFCKYETKWHKCSAMFGLPSYYPVNRIAENNVWGTEHGRGTFFKCYEKMVRGKTQSVLASNQETLSPKKNAYFTQLADTFSELMEKQMNALLKCQNSETLRFIPDKSVDLVITDPPYFDNLNYSRLADFFYVWLRIGLMNDYDSFKPSTSTREREVVMDGSRDRTTDELVNTLSNIFKECKRILRPNRPMVFTFHHTQSWAWRGLLESIRAGGFSIVNSHFIRSEGRTGFRKNGQISYDICVICRKSEEIVPEESRRLAASRSRMWVNRLFQSGNGLQDSDVHSIVMGNLLTYTPGIVLNGFEKDQWAKNILAGCIDLKNSLEKSKHDESTIHDKSKQTKLAV